MDLKKKNLIALALVIIIPLYGLFYGLSTRPDELQARSNIPENVQVFFLDQGKVMCVIYNNITHMGQVVGTGISCVVLDKNSL